VQCLKLLGSYNITLLVCVVGLPECACASYVANGHPISRSHKTPGQRRVSWYERAHVTCGASHTYIMFHVRGAGHLRTSADDHHQGIVTISRYRRGLCHDIAIKKVHDSSPSLFASPVGRVMFSCVCVPAQQCINRHCCVW